MSDGMFFYFIFAEEKNLKPINHFFNQIYLL
jgi:hypothetical protein